MEVEFNFIKVSDDQSPGPDYVTLNGLLEFFCMPGTLKIPPG